MSLGEELLFRVPKVRIVPRTKRQFVEDFCIYNRGDFSGSIGGSTGSQKTIGAALELWDEIEKQVPR